MTLEESDAKATIESLKQDAKALRSMKESLECQVEELEADNLALENDHEEDIERISRPVRDLCDLLERYDGTEPGYRLDLAEAIRKVRDAL